MKERLLKMTDMLADTPFVEDGKIDPYALHVSVCLLELRYLREGAAAMRMSVGGIRDTRFKYRSLNMVPPRGEEPRRGSELWKTFQNSLVSRLGESGSV